MKAKMYASMVEPITMQPESDEEFEVDDFAEEEDLSEETDDIELELIDIESIEDES